MLRQIDERLILERICERLPVVDRIVKENMGYNAILQKLAVILQKNQILLDESEIKAAGRDPQAEAKELTDAIEAVRLMAVRYQ